MIPQSEFDLVLANPPFRPQTLRVRESIFPDHTLPVRTNDAHRAFLQRTLLSLKPGGESAIIVPDSVLTHSGSDAIRVRRWIVEEFQCRAIVKLPFHTFYPQAAVNASVLFVRRPEPSEAGSRAWEKVFFFAVELDGRSNDTRRQPVDRNDFDELRKIWGDQDSLWREWCGQPHRANAHNIQVPAQWNHPHFWFAALEDIRRGDYSLLPERYRPAQLLSEPVPPPEELLDDLQTLGQEIMDLLRQLAEANYEP